MLLHSSVPPRRCRCSTSNRSGLLPSKSFTIHHLSIILTFNAILPKIPSSPYPLLFKERQPDRSDCGRSGTPRFDAQMVHWRGKCYHGTGYRISVFSFYDFSEIVCFSERGTAHQMFLSFHSFPPSCQAKRMQITTFSWPTFITLHRMDTILHSMAPENSSFSHCTFIKCH
jgi:hypothetical protein